MAIISPETNPNSTESISLILAGIIESSPDAIFIKNFDGVYIQCNEKFSEIIGKPVSQIIGKKDDQLLDSKKAIYFDAEDKAILLSGKKTTNIDWSLLPDSRKILLETVKAPILDKDGKAIGIIGIGRDITERHESQITISEKTAEVENFFDISSDPLLITEPDGRILRANQAWLRTLGFDLTNILSHPFFSFIHPDDQEMARKALASLCSNQTSVDFTCRLRTIQGDWRYYEWRCQSENNRYYLASRDISTRLHDEMIQDRQKAQLEFRQRFEETLTSISTKLINLPNEQVNAAIDEVLSQIGQLIDVDRSYVFLFDHQNQTMTNTHEWAAEGIEPEKDNLVDLPQSIFPWWMERLNKLETINVPSVTLLPDAAIAEREILQMQGIQSVLVLPLISDKELIGFLGFDSVKQPIQWSSDSIILIRMVSDIISNALMRFKYQKDLAQSEYRKSALLLAVPDLIFRADRKGNIVDINLSSDHNLNAAILRCDLKRFQDLVGEGEQDNVAQAILSAMETRELQTIEFRFGEENASWVLEARILFSGEDEVTAIVRDVSDRARLEQIKSDFINKATHELRTPIATMMLMSNLIDGASNDEERSEYWSIMKSELEREKTLVDDILTAGRMDNPQIKINLRNIDLSAMYTGFMAKTDILAKEKGVFIDSNYTRDPKITSDDFRSDEGLLNQILGNLFNNAIKFTPVGGQINFNMKVDKKGLTLQVKDNGIGIPAEDVPFLFSRFFRATNAIQNQIQGTGIGLYIVRSLVEKLNGTIKLSTKLDEGTEFIIKLPRA